MEFDESKNEDPEYLIKWYQYRISKIKGRRDSTKTVAHYKRAIKRQEDILKSKNNGV